MKFSVLVESIISKEIKVEASSHEEAVKLVNDMKLVLSGKARTTWVGTEASVDLDGHFEYKNLGPCEWCKLPIVDRSIPGQPWTYGGDPDNEHGGFVCYPCLLKAGKVKTDASTQGARSG